MSLKIQCLTILFSFLFGIFFYISYILCKKILYHRNLFIKIFLSFIFCMIEIYIYYLLLEKINSGIFHIYGFLSFFVGLSFTYLIFTKNRT